MEDEDFKVDLKPNIMAIDSYTKISGGDYRNYIHVNKLAKITENLA